MEKKANNKILIGLIVILVIALLACLIFIFTRKNDENNVQNILTNEEKTSTNADDKYDGIIDKQIELNGENINIKLSYINKDIIEENEDSKLCEQEYSFSLNDKNIAGLDNGSKYLDSNNEIAGELYSLSKIKDTLTNREYLILQIYRDNMAGGSVTDIYIIDDEASKTFIKLTDDSNVSEMYLKEKLETDEEGTYIPNEQYRLKMQILEDKIIKFAYNSDNDKVEEKIYKINNGILNIETGISYNQDDIFVVGKSW